MNAIGPSIPVVKSEITRAQILKAAATMGIVGSGANSGLRMLAVLFDPKVDEAEVAALIGRHPSMYARVLRVANSPYYGQSRAVTTLERALLLLGRDAVRSIAAATCFDQAMARGKKVSVIDMKAVARHSVATAAAAEALATIARPPMAPEAFIAGLLHNLGIAVQVSLDPRGIEAMIVANCNGAHGIRGLEADNAVIGHEESLGVVFEAWQMPDSLVAAASHHHAPMMAPLPHRDLAALVNLASTLAIANCHGYGLEPGPVEHERAAMLWLELTDEQLCKVGSLLPGRVSELVAALFDA